MNLVIIYSSEGQARVRHQQAGGGRLSAPRTGAPPQSGESPTCNPVASITKYPLDQFIKIRKYLSQISRAEHTQFKRPWESSDRAFRLYKMKIRLSLVLIFE